MYTSNKRRIYSLLNCEQGKLSREHVLDKNNVNEAHDTFIYDFTVPTENRYKFYKNKLPVVLRCAKKKYYCILLLEQRKQYCRYLEDITNNYG